MSEETFVNIATEIQQPYIARVPANAQEPNIRQVAIQSPANARQPNTYQHRSPFIYNNPVSAQEPNIRNARQPSTYVRQGQSPAAYQHRSPFTYVRTGQQPAIYQHQQPYPYIATGQEPNGRNAQQPYPYIAQARASGFYQHPSPFTYQNPVSGQQPNIANSQIPHPYIATGQEPNIAAGQEPNIRNAQALVDYQHRSPFTYRNPVSGREPNIRNNQSPFTYQRTGQTPTTYTVSVTTQEPNIRNNQTAFTYNYRSPFTYRNPVSGQEPNIRNARQPSDAQQPSESQTPYPYIANARSPFTYQHRSPFTYARQGQTPFTYNVQTPATTSQRSPAVGRTPFIFDGVDGDDNGVGNTTWGPGNSAAQHTNAQYSQGTTNRTWDTQRSYQSSFSNSAAASMEFNYQTSGSNVNKVKTNWYAVDSAQIGPAYEDYIDVYSPIDNSWSIDVKWTSSADQKTQQFGGSAKAPFDSSNPTGAKAKNTWHNVWNGSSQTGVEFKWSTNSGNSNQNPYAEMMSTAVQIQLRVYKTGETTLYTTGPSNQTVRLVSAKGGGAPL